MVDSENLSDDEIILKAFPQLDNIGNLKNYSPSGYTNLLEDAINLNADPRVIAIAVSRGADVTSFAKQVYRKGNTLLHLAVALGYEEVVTKLIKAGADVNKANELGETPLSVARKNGNEKILFHLLDKDEGALILVGYPQLHAAIMSKNNEAIKSLLENSDINQQNKQDGYTPLITAVRYNNPEAVTLLLNAGADPKQLDDGFSLLQVAAELGNNEVMKVLLERDADVNFTQRGFTPLNYAVKNNNVSGMNLLIEKGAGISEKDQRGNSLLNIAAHYGSIEAIRALSNNATINEKNEYGVTPLYAAINADKFAAAEELVNLGANINVTDSEKFTLLHMLAEDKNGNNCMKLLIDKKADVNLVNVHGQSPLHIAVGANNIEAARMLIDAGAIIDLPDKNGVTPLTIAMANKNNDMVNFLIDKGADIKQLDADGFGLLHLAVHFDNIEAMELLIDKELDVNKANGSGCSPLHTAIAKNNTPAIKTLIKNKADVNKLTPYNELPLTMYLRNENPDKGVLKEFIKNGAKLDVVEFKQDNQYKEKNNILQKAKREVRIELFKEKLVKTSDKFIDMVKNRRNSKTQAGTKL
jgi:ankyrin repeat protein